MAGEMCLERRGIKADIKACKRRFQSERVAGN